jgi:hypothetical protein
MTITVRLHACQCATVVLCHVVIPDCRKLQNVWRWVVLRRHNILIVFRSNRSTSSKTESVNTRTQRHIPATAAPSVTPLQQPQTSHTYESISAETSLELS